MTNRNTSARAAIGGSFFLTGLCFSSWGSRIPTIQEYLGLSEAQLGSVLLSVPAGCIVSIPLAAYIVSRFGSRRTLIAGMLLYGAFLACLGAAPSVFILVAMLCGFGFASNLVNVALNTQAIELELLYDRPLMASMHGLWSVAGFTGAAIGALMIALHFTPKTHFLIIAVSVGLAMLAAGRFLLPDLSKKVVKETTRFRLPEKSLLVFGVMVFCGMLCEGGMFDWAGVYFRKVIGAEGAFVSAGYIAFMSTMAGTRFVADGFKARFGFRKVLVVSGLLIFAGYMLAVALPYAIPATIGFLMIGSGMSTVVPLVFSEAGRSKTTKASTAVATVSTIGFFGFLIGPPMIGWIAGLTTLRVSFAVVAMVGLCISLFATRLKRLTA